MLKFAFIALTVAGLLATGAGPGQSHANTALETNRTALTVINNSHMHISLDYDNSQVNATTCAPVTINIEKPDLDNNLGFLCFTFAAANENRTACLPTVRAPQAFWQNLNAANALTLTFYDENQTTYAVAASGQNNPDSSIKYMYHPVLKTWGVVEEAYGIVVFQDDKGEYNTFEAAQRFDTSVPTSWEHLYPGEISKWLRSPLESRCFIVPLTAIYTADTWADSEFASFKLARLTPTLPKVTGNQLIVLKTMGDFGWGLLTYQNAAGQWFFMEYGFDGWGVFGGMWYRLHNAPPAHITPNPKDAPWLKP